MEKGLLSTTMDGPKTEDGSAGAHVALKVQQEHQHGGSSRRLTHDAVPVHKDDGKLTKQEMDKFESMHSHPVLTSETV